jgi:hypothetical protein
MRDGFGSVSLLLFPHNLTQLGLNTILTAVILNSNSNARVKVVPFNGATGPIYIKRGIKQGCPLSLKLMDICIDFLIERLSSREFKEFVYWWSDINGVTVNL